MKNSIYAIFLLFVFLACSTKKNKPINKGYHSLVSSYNVLFNGNQSLNEGLLQTEEGFTENYWDILPIEKLNISQDIITVGGIENENFLKGEEKAAKTVQKHSMQIDGAQRNPKIANAYMLLGKARYFDQRFVPSLDAFNQVFKQSNEQTIIDGSLIWKAKANIRLEQENLALEILNKLLQKESLSKENILEGNAALAMAYLKLDEEKKAVKPLKIAHEIENNNLKKARYLYILGQILEKQSNKDSANIFFKKVYQFNRKIPRELFVNAKLKTLLLGSLENDKKESQFKKMIENYENEDFLDKIFFNYSMFLFSKNSNDLAKIYLNKAVRENSNDKELLYRAFIKMSKIYFENSDYLIAGKYLDSTLNNLDKKSKKFWEIQRQKKGISQIIQLENNINLYDSLIKISSYDSEKLNNTLKEIERNETQIKVDDEKQAKINRQTTGFKSKSKKSNFYFYNDNLVALGKNSFETLWGVRVKQTYWRNPISSQTSQVKLSEKAINEKETNQTESFVSDEKSDLLSSIPRTKVQKDSIFNLKNDSYLRLAELYLVKYKDFGSAESRLKKVINSDPKQNFVAEANYLLYKLYKQQGLKTAEEIKSKIINNHPNSKFSKILQNANSLVVEEEFLIKKLDSLQTLFKEQKFNLVINEIDKQLNLIESQKISVDYELLKAASYGRLEGILYYGEMLKEIINKYPNSPRADELKGISKEINKKWKLKKDNEKSGKHLLVYIVDSESLNQEVLGKIKNVLDNSKRVSFDVYNQTTNFLVIGDFLNLENANKSRGFLEKKIELLKLNNNFVVLSSQYKNMLIYKTLDLFIK